MSTAHVLYRYRGCVADTRVNLVIFALDLTKWIQRRSVSTEWRFQRDLHINLSLHQYELRNPLPPPLGPPPGRFVAMFAGAYQQNLVYYENNPLLMAWTRFWTWILLISHRVSPDLPYTWQAIMP